MKKHLVIHHRADADGWFSGCLIKKYINSIGNQCDLLGIDYKDKEPDFNLISSYDEVHITDFTLSEALMTEWHRRWPNSLWFDHHVGPITISASKNYGMAAGLRGESYSATMLVTKYLYPKFENNLGLTLVDIADLHKKDDAVAFEQAMNLGAWLKLCLDEESTMDCIHQFIANPMSVHTCISAGQKIRNADMAFAKRVKPLRVTFFGEEFPAVNTYHNSLAYDERFKDELALIMFTIHGNLVKMSARSIAPDYSVRTLCERLGGGGHDRASGCEISINYFYNAIIK